MNFNDYLEKMKSTQQNILEYINDEEDPESKLQNIKDILTKNKIKDKKDELISFLCLLAKISNNHHRTPNFISKIERILEYLKDDLQKLFSNSELLHIFRSSKRILLFLIETKILIIDKSIAKYLAAKYILYFRPEIQPFINKQWLLGYETKNENQEDFYEQRKIGENEHFICELIRKDLNEDFIVYINKNNYQFNSTIKPSIYETNNFLLKKEHQYQHPTLIEYAAFFGSIQIFNYLRNKGVKLTPSLWEYGIHGNSAEIIQILEENRIRPPEKKSYKELFKESIKCHHNDIANYIQDNYLENLNEESKYVVVNVIKYHNFEFIKKEQINEASFNYLCKYDHCTLVSILLSTMNIDINHKTIYKKKSFLIQFLN